jgi:ubiquinone/menaquinone biosynthesis C-methylase UbiE
MAWCRQNGPAIEEYPDGEFMTNPGYVLGHSDRELARLKVQARLIEPATRHFFREAGIESGMRVLDIGSGAGDVAFLAAELVGAGGEVIGTDKSAAAVAAATLSARERGLSNVSFREGDPAESVFDRPFDAVVGRYVLLFQADPAALVRKVARHVRPGGAVVFHEPDWTTARSIPPSPTYDRCCGWIQEAFRRSGTDTNMAGRLFTTFVGAGLKPPSMRMQTFIAGGAKSAEFLQAVADLTTSLVPAMERFGIATKSEVAWETLAERLAQEAIQNGSVIVGRSEICAWAKV